MKTPSGTGQMDINGIECRYMNAADMMLGEQTLHYVDVFGLRQLISTICYDSINQRWDPPNIMLNGHKGLGKSLLLASYAQANQIPYFAVDCSEETKPRDLKGGFVAKSGSTPFVLGTVTNAILVANQMGKAMIVFEEISALSPQRQKDLNPLTDFRKKVEVPELGTRFELDPTALLFVCATRNPEVYGGTYDLNEDLKSRFMEIEVPYPSKEDEIRILKDTSPNATKISTEAISRLVDLANETRQKSTSYALSTRDLTQLLRVIDRVGWEDALFLAAQKFPTEDRDVIYDRIRDITTISIYKNLVERKARTA